MYAKMRPPTLFRLMIAALLLPAATRAQNLLANPSFEIINICTEYRAPCAPVAWESVSPASKLLFNYHTYRNKAGHQYIVLLAGDTREERNYAQTRLLCPLRKGQRYRLSGIVGATGKLQPELDFYLSKDYVFREQGRALTDLKPTVTFRKEQVVKELEKNFYRMEMEFEAADDYTHLLMGRMELLPSRRLEGPESVFIDWLELVPVDGRPLCPEASAVEDSLGRRFHRHTLPGQAISSINPVVPLIGPGCVDIDIPGPEIFTATGRERYPRSAARVDSMILRYEPHGGRRVFITGVHFDFATKKFDKQTSAQQAETVRQVLVKDFGFSSDDIKLIVLDSAIPRFDFNSPTGRARNNYVAIEFCVADPSAQPPPPPVIETVKIAPPPDTLVIPDILFKFDRHELNPALFRTLDSLVAKIPRSPGVTLQLVGHTDNAGADDYNLLLSQRRAASLADYLRGKGLGDFILAVSGEGEHRPAFPNDTPEGRRRNRRVEIIIYRQ